MAYSQFNSIMKLKALFPEIDIEEGVLKPKNYAKIEPSVSLTEGLDYSTPFALKANTEKARSEMIVTPILLEVLRKMKDTIGIFSGNELNVDKKLGLNGVCDFLLSSNIESSFMMVPILTIVEAKKDDIPAGQWQCIAEMIGAERFNKMNGYDVSPIIGLVTNGLEWQFLKKEGNKVMVNPTSLYINNLAELLGWLVGLISLAKVTKIVKK